MSPEGYPYTTSPSDLLSQHFHSRHLVDISPWDWVAKLRSGTFPRPPMLLPRVNSNLLLSFDTTHIPAISIPLAILSGPATRDSSSQPPRISRRGYGV